MKFYKVRVSFPYLVVFVLIIFGSFLISCGHVKMLEYDDEETYTDMDKGFFAPPTPSDIDKALNILLTTSTNNTDNVRWAISIIVKPIDNSTVDIGDINRTFSIDEFVESFYKTLGEGSTVSKDTLKRVEILALNVAINEVNKNPEHRLEPIKAIFFALGERLVKNGIKEISENMADQTLLDTASFEIMSVVINHLISVSLTDPIAKEIMENQEIPADLFEEQGFFYLGCSR